MLFNRARAIEYMRRYDLDALVATSPANITYFTDFYMWLHSLFREYMIVPGASSNLFRGYAVFPLEGDPALVVPMTPLFAANAADVWVPEVQVFGESGLDESMTPVDLPPDARRVLDMQDGPERGASPTDSLLGILATRGLTDARIGLEKEGLPVETAAEIAERLPAASIQDCTNLIRLVRMVKSEEETARLAHAAEISEQAGMESLALARPGRPVADLVQHYRARVAELGADFEHYLYGMHGMGIGSEPNYVLSEGEVLYVDFGCIYKHYFSDTGTTLSMSEPPAELRARHEALKSCMADAVETIRPGTRSSTVRDAMWDTLSANGVRVSFPHGHGLGLEIRDYPILVADNGGRIVDDCVDVPSDIPLEEGMVINLEAAVFMPGVASLHIEQTFVVTSDGSRLLVPQDRSGPVMPASAPV